MALPTGGLLRRVFPILLKGGKLSQVFGSPILGFAGTLVKEEAREARRVGGRVCGIWVPPDGRSR